MRCLLYVVCYGMRIVGHVDAILGLSWEDFGATLDFLGAILGYVEAILGQPWEVLGGAGAHPGVQGVRVGV